MEVLREIPVVNDMVTSIGATLDDLYKYFDGDMLDTFYRFNAELSDEKLCKYIEFINMTGLEPRYYKDIIKFINEENIDKVLDLFVNNDIKIDLFPMIPYELAIKVWSTNYLKELWLTNNLEWVTNNKDKVSQYIVLDDYHIYYDIGGEIFTSNPSEIKGSLEYLLDMEMAVKSKLYKVAKYILENINKSKERNVGSPSYEFMFYTILGGTNVDKDQVDVMKLLLLNVKDVYMNRILKRVYDKNYELFKFLYEILTDCLEEIDVSNDMTGMEVAIPNFEYERLVENRSHSTHIEETDPLNRAIEDNNHDEIINLLQNGVKLTLLDLLHIMYLNRWNLDDDLYRFLLDNCVMNEIESYILKDVLEITL